MNSFYARKKNNLMKFECKKIFSILVNGMYHSNLFKKIIVSVPKEPIFSGIRLKHESLRNSYESEKAAILIKINHKF